MQNLIKITALILVLDDWLFLVLGNLVLTIYGHIF